MKRSSIALVGLSVGYFFLAAWRLPLVRAQLNPDGVAYLSIAGRYLAGDSSGALNGHWGPMFSWLLAPLLWLGFEPLLACKIETFATGFAALLTAWCLTSRYTQSLFLRSAVSAALIPLLVSWASQVVSPDLLLVCFLSAYAFFISDPNPCRRSTLLAAIFGALTYFAKSYGFVFFLAHFTLVCAFRREARRYFLPGLAVFLALALPWAGALSLKYQKLTFGTAAAYNIGLVGPANGPVGSQFHPVQNDGLFAPPDEQAVSAWDDPTFLKFPPWPSFRESFSRLCELVRENIFVLFDTLQAFSILAWPLAAAALIFPFLPSLRGAQSRLLLATPLSGALYVAGYLPLLIEERYVWILPVLLLMIAAGLVELATRHFHLNAISSAALSTILAATFVIRPLTSLPVAGELEIESAKIAQALNSNGINLRGRRLASDDRWAQGLYVAYLAQARYFGAIARERSAAIRTQLDQYGIDTFLVLDHSVGPPVYLEGFHEVPVPGAQVHFALYQRKP